MTRIVKGTFASEFFTMFWPMRFTYSVTIGSLMNLTLFSISIETPLPSFISDSVEYQLPRPRPPISRVPTELTSSWLPCFTPGITPFGPGAGAVFLRARIAVSWAAAISAAVGWQASSLSSLPFFLSFLSFFFPLSFPLLQAVDAVGVLAGVAVGVDCGFVGVCAGGIVGGVVGELPGVVVLVGA